MINCHFVQLSALLWQYTFAGYFGLQEPLEMDYLLYDLRSTMANPWGQHLATWTEPLYPTATQPKPDKTPAYPPSQCLLGDLSCIKPSI